MAKDTLQIPELTLKKLSLAVASRDRINLYIEAMLEATFAAEGIEYKAAEWTISASGLATHTPPPVPPAPPAPEEPE